MVGEETRLHLLPAHLLVVAALPRCTGPGDVEPHRGERRLLIPLTPVEGHAARLTNNPTIKQTGAQDWVSNSRPISQWLFVTLHPPSLWHSEWFPVP